MDNFKGRTVFCYDNLNKKDINASIDFIDVCETLCRELSNSMKIVKKF